MAATQNMDCFFCEFSGATIFMLWTSPQESLYVIDRPVATTLPNVEKVKGKMHDTLHKISGPKDDILG